MTAEDSKPMIQIPERRDPDKEACRKIAVAKEALRQLGPDDGKPIHLRVLTPPRG